MSHMAAGSRQNRIAWLVATLFVGYGLRVVHLDAASLWLDELIQVHLAKAPLPQMLGLVFVHANAPLDVLITKMMLQLGEQDAWMRMSSVYMGVLSIPLIYALARKLLPDPAPFIAALLLALAPLAVEYNREIRPYSTFLMLTLLSALLFLWALERPRLWPLFALSLLLLLHTHLFAMTLPAVYGAYWLMWILPEGLRKRDARSLLLAPTVLALTVILFLLSPGSPDYIGRFIRAALKGIRGPRAMETLALASTTHPFPGFIPIIKNILQHFSGARPLGLPALALLLLGLVSLRRRPRALSFLLAWLFLVSAGILFALYQRDHWFSPRYIIHAMPPFLMLVSMGMVTLANLLARGVERVWDGRSARAARFPLALAALLILYLWSTAPALARAQGALRENLRDSAAFLQEIYEPDTLIIAPLVGPYLLGHYLPQDMNVIDLQSPALVEAAAQNYGRVFLLQTVYSRLNSDNAPWLTPDNLIASFQPGVKVYRVPAGENARELVHARIQAILNGETEPSIAELQRMAAEARKLKDWDLAIALLEHLLNLAPNHAGSWVDLGLAYRQTEQLDAAIEAYEKAIELAPNNGWAHLLLANALRLKGQPRAAVERAQMAVEIAPRLPDAWAALGYALLELGDAAAARAAFERGLEQQSDSLALKYGLAQAASAARATDAAALWQALLEENPPDFVRNAACKHLQNAHPLCQ